MALCAHMGCSAPAEAGLLHNPRSRTVWLVEIPGEDHLMTALCSHHADTIVVPHGWELHDQRDGHPRLWALDGATTAVPTRRSRRSRRPTSSSPNETQPETTLWSEAEADDRPGSTPATGAAPAARNTSDWVGAPAERHSDLLEAGEDTPLLARAFRASRAS